MAPAAVQALSAECRRLAAELGFDACGITGTAAIAHPEALQSWLANGYHGDMGYMPRQKATRIDPSRTWEEARSIVVVLHNYYCEPSAPYGMARYAQGVDYHRVTKNRLDTLGRQITALAGHGTWRSFVDAGPMPERELAQRAGLGWMGKNTMLINPRLGSFTFIGVALTDLDLEPDAPFEADRCGSCRRCLDACPTQAFVAPRVLDARRCISYLTIESRKDIPEDLREKVGDWLFGCDVCQDVCPWNVRFAQPATEPAFAPRPTDEWPTLQEILKMEERHFDEAFGESAIERARLSGLKRNALVVLENSAHQATRPGDHADREGQADPAKRGE